MQSEQFNRSWAALYLWMEALNTRLAGCEVLSAFTHRKQQLELHFNVHGSELNLIWKTAGQNATLALFERSSLPRKRVDVLKKLVSKQVFKKAVIHSKDRILAIRFESGIELILGFYPAALNAFLLENGEASDQFFKQPTLPELTDDWIDESMPLPDDIPGNVGAATLRLAQAGLHLSENGSLEFGPAQTQTNLDITQLGRAVQKQQKIKSAPEPLSALVQHARTLQKRWQQKLAKIKDELDAAKTWPEEQIRLQGLQIAQAMQLVPEDGCYRIPTEMSPTGEALTLSGSDDIPLTTEIERSAKSIRKSKLKLSQLDQVVAEVKNDIQAIGTLLEQPDFDKLNSFLSRHGKTIDARGTQKSERTPFKKYTSPSGYDILVGRGSKDNDTLTFKVANKNDWWFHARQIRGSHVILRTGNQLPQRADIQRAAEYAARNSKAQHAGIVVVQYCQRKHLSKPKGAPPGTVLVHHEQSITIDLDQSDLT